MYYRSNPGCTQARQFRLLFSLACPCRSKLYLGTWQVLDSLVTRVHVSHSFVLSPDKVNMPVWVMLEFVNWTVIPFRPFDFKRCYIPSRYSILEINQQVIYIFNKLFIFLHTFPKWVWYAIWISWMRVKILKFPSEVLKIATVLCNRQSIGDVDNLTENPKTYYWEHFPKNDKVHCWLP